MPTRWLDQLEIALIYAMAGFLFWPNAVSSISMIGLIVLTLVRKRKAFLPSLKELILLLPAVLILVGWAVHGFTSAGEMEVQLWATWLGALLYFRTGEQRRHFPTALALNSLAQAVVVLSVFVLSDHATADNFSQFMRDQLGDIFGVHPTYVSAVWLWSGIWIVLERSWPVRYRQLTVGTLVIMAVLFGGKMPFIGFVAVIGWMILQQVKGTWKRLGMAGMLVVFMAGNIMLNPGLKARFGELVTLNLDYQEGQWLNSTELRIGIWKCGIDIASEHWLMGVGTGNTRAALDACYERYGQVEFFETEFNSHNQYLHFMLTGGVFSALLFLTFFIWLFIQAIRRKQSTLIAFLLYAGLLLMTENYFSRQSGMMFMAFVLMYLYFDQQSPEGSAASTLAT